MSGWTDVFLGVIAAATLITSILQVGVLVAAGRVAMRLMRLFGHLDSIGRDAARTASLAAAQVERADGLFADLTQRIETTMDTVQTAVGMPAREGAAILAGLRAALSTFRAMRGTRGRRARGEDEDALFI